MTGLTMIELDDITQRDIDDQEFWDGLKIDYQNAVRAHDRNATAVAFQEALCMGQDTDTIHKWEMEVWQEVCDFLLFLNQPELFEEGEEVEHPNVSSALVYYIERELANTGMF